MGAAKSKSVIQQSVTNKQISKTDIEQLNQQVSEFISETATSNATSCSASSSQAAKLKIGKITAKGPGSTVKVGDETDQKTTITLSCLIQNLQQSKIDNSIASAIMTSLSKSVEQDTMTKLVNEAESKAKQGFGGIGFSQSDSKVNTNINNESLSYTNTKLNNLIKNAVTNKSKTKNASECGTKIAQNLAREFGDLEATDGGVIELQFTTKQVADSIAKCQIITSQVSDVTSNIANTLGIAITEDNKQKTATESSAKATSKAENEGAAGFFAALFGMAMLPYILSGCAAICLIIIVLFVLKSVMGTKIDDSSFNQMGAPMDGLMSQMGPPMGPQMGSQMGPPMGPPMGKYPNY